jgi:mRNA interferase HigB
MTLVGQHVLLRVERRNAPLRHWLTIWVSAVENATWSSLDDVYKEYPSADGIKMKGGLVVTVFNVKGNNYRLLTLVDYDEEIVQVLDVITHAEYNKDKWKNRY